MKKNDNKIMKVLVFRVTPIALIGGYSYVYFQVWNYPFWKGFCAFPLLFVAVFLWWCGNMINEV